MTSVRWLLAQRSLELSLRAGAAGLDRQLDCAVSSELAAAADWLAGGEVLLTTGFRLPAAAAVRRDYIIGLHEVGVAALGFGVGLGFDDVPAEMLAAADQVGLPVFEVPLNIPFSAIMRAVLDQIAAEGSARLLAATRAQPRMTRAAAAHGPSAVVRELADAIGSRVVLLNAGHVEVACAPPVPAPVDVERVRALVVRDPAAAGAARIHDDVTVTMARVGSGTQTFGHLGVVGPTPDDVSRMLIGHAVSLLAIDYAKPMAVRRDTTRLQGDVLAVALDGMVGPAGAELLGRAADRDGQVRGVVYRFADTDDARRGATRLAEELEQRWRPVFVHHIGTEVIVLLRGDDHIQFATGLLHLLSASGPVRGGLGPPSALRDDAGDPRVRAVADSVAQARLAGRSAAVGQVVDLVGTRSLLSIEPVRQVLLDSYTHRLAPLVEHDRVHSTALRRSLLAFLEANGNWGVAAAELGVHRHTLRSRIERIEDMLAMDLTDARTRAELLLMLLGAHA